MNVRSRVANDLTRPLLMLPGSIIVKHTLENVGKGTVTEVVKERSSFDRFAVFLQGLLDALFRMMPDEQLIDHAPREVEYAQGVYKPRMLGARIDEVGQPKLSDSPETLKLLGIDQIQDELILGL